MKKTVSIALLLLVLLVAVHPALALHFCGGNLRSVSLVDEHEICCCSDTGISDSSAGNFKKGCCSTAVVELSTDQYQSQSLTVRSVPVAFELAVPDFLLSLFSHCSYSGYSDDATPHAPPFREGRQLLVLHCIFRI